MAALLTNLRHGLVSLDDPVTRHLVRLLDGTRTVDQLVSDLAAAVAAERRRMTETRALTPP